MEHTALIHSYTIEDAKKYGVDRAALLYNIKFWLSINKNNGTNVHDGYYWTYNTAQAFSELFPYFSKKKIHRLLVELEKCGALISGRFSKNKLDQTKWYTTPSFSVVDDIKPCLPVLKCTPTECTPTTKPKADNKVNNFLAESVELPDSVDRDAWEEWVKYRVEIGKPIKSAATASKLIKMLDEQFKIGIKTQSIVDQSIASGWLGLFPLRNNTQQPSEAEKKLSRNNWNTEEGWASENLLFDY